MKKDLDDVNLSGLGVDEVDALFNAAQTKAVPVLVVAGVRLALLQREKLEEVTRLATKVYQDLCDSDEEFVAKSKSHQRHQVLLAIGRKGCGESLVYYEYIKYTKGDAIVPRARKKSAVANVKNPPTTRFKGELIHLSQDKECHPAEQLMNGYLSREIAIGLDVYHKNGTGRSSKVELMQLLIEKGYCAKPRDKLSEEAAMNLNCWIDDRLRAKKGFSCSGPDLFKLAHEVGAGGNDEGVKLVQNFLSAARRRRLEKANGRWCWKEGKMPAGLDNRDLDDLESDFSDEEDDSNHFRVEFDAEVAPPAERSERHMCRHPHKVILDDDTTKSGSKYTDVQEYVARAKNVTAV